MITRLFKEWQRRRDQRRAEAQYIATHPRVAAWKRFTGEELIAGEAGGSDRPTSHAVNEGREAA